VYLSDASWMVEDGHGEYECEERGVGRPIGECGGGGEGVGGED